ncbi:hypothetical protein TRIUR3_03739 [Triticum urartu]|uniref:Uncharacterized protein n=1 Tax=Triticum urartu TaxID=4572 RepID=M7ZV77_TRIUA|nr:hypothetical protein TRIUR3_03739 [Triticum urartu]
MARPDHMRDVVSIALASNKATRGDDTGGRAARRVEEVVATRGDGGVETTAGRGEVGQQGGLRKDVHRGGGHRGHQGLRRRRDGDGARRDL